MRLSPNPRFLLFAFLLSLGCASGGGGSDGGGIALHAPGPADPDAPEEFTTTASGLQYRIRRKSGGYRPQPTDRVKVHYRGWLDDGTVFDSSYERGEPAEFALNQVVPGWTEGLQLVGVGGMIELVVPPELGYGSQDKGKIPPNSRLHFLVELLEVPMASVGQ